MRKWIIIASLYAALAGALVWAIGSANKANKKLDIAEANVKAYDELLGSSKEKNVVLQLTTEQLSNVRDSLLRQLNDTRKELKIKDKNLKSMQHVSSTLSRTDTIVLNDTIFKEVYKKDSVVLDTLVGDKWYKARIRLDYPSSIIFRPEFKSEKQIFVSTRKETVNPPKKWWIQRLFQRKHTVVRIDVVESNPYVGNEESRYVEVVK